MKSFWESLTSKKVLAILVGLLIYRVFFAVNLVFWNSDEKHIFLQGLHFYTTGEWPFFGADVVHTKTRIAGALQSLLVGLPMWLLHLPEAPFIILNTLSLLGLAVFAYYLHRRFPQRSFIFLLLWLAFLPWTLEFGTHLYNPSYLLFGTCLFFVGFFERIPALSTGWLSPFTSFFFMGFGLGWAVQLHLSWPILLPFLPLVLFSKEQSIKDWGRNFSGAFVGFFLTSLLLIPTLVKFGPDIFLNAGANNAGFQWEHLWLAPQHLMRLVSFGCYEILTFLGNSTEERMSFIAAHFWLAPFIGFLVLAGFAQAPAISYWTWRMWKNRETPHRQIIYLFVFTIMVAWLVYCFTKTPLKTRNLYLLLPPSVLFVTACLDYGLRSPRGILLWKACVGVSAIYFFFLAAARFPEQSLYRDRAKITRAMVEKKSEIFGKLRYPRYPQKKVIKAAIRRTRR